MISGRRISDRYVSDRFRESKLPIMNHLTFLFSYHIDALWAVLPHGAPGLGHGTLMTKPNRFHDFGLLSRRKTNE